MTATLSKLVPKAELRRGLSQMLSRVFSETPIVGAQYTKVCDVVSELRREAGLPSEDVHIPKHGAMRFGSPKDMFTMKRFLALAGMHPVNVYDLSLPDNPNAVPAVSTAFRPSDSGDLRLFASQLQLYHSSIPQGLAEELRPHFEQRGLFNPESLELIQKAERDGGLTEADAADLLQHAEPTFRYKNSGAPLELFKKSEEHSKFLADVVVGTGLNHLTPETGVPIEKVYDELARRHGEEALLPAIQGPKTKVLTQLKQSALIAPPQEIQFIDKNGEIVMGTNPSSFVEFENDGIALTPKGQKQLAQSANLIPDTAEKIFEQELGFYTLHVTEKGRKASKETLASLSTTEMEKQEFVEKRAVIYKDFLPISAAGIFKATLGNREAAKVDPEAIKAATEEQRERNRRFLIDEGLHGEEPVSSDLLYTQETYRSLEALAALSNFPSVEELQAQLPKNNPCRHYQPEVEHQVDPSRATITRSPSRDNGHKI